MATRNDHRAASPRTRQIRQLRHIRAFYGAGFALWAASAAWTGLESPGSRQMWVALLLLGVFTGLLLTASTWVRRLESDGPRRPARHAAARVTATSPHGTP
ncbi:hypothetical protein SAM40697_6478 [Streptomyces ambofaciens]|uniref:Uncharacterized protein n=3 Tax=Streptomyces ambofaciens TaxID=1889 RepID=A0ACC0_STRA7|nr:hypothetical protein [Streptomyces ambofaciens]ANB10431.1 hypothetical protein SAM40697_6478 [Streptomyces ambofaciens]CAJ88124.1 conserved hypothetical protein [Streptomyces ambofaciens ATCC 23877]